MAGDSGLLDTQSRDCLNIAAMLHMGSLLEQISTASHLWCVATELANVFLSIPIVNEDQKHFPRKDNSKQSQTSPGPKVTPLLFVPV